MDIGAGEWGEGHECVDLLLVVPGLALDAAVDLRGGVLGGLGRHGPARRKRSLGSEKDGFRRTGAGEYSRWGDGGSSAFLGTAGEELRTLRAEGRRPTQRT